MKISLTFPTMGKGPSFRGGKTPIHSRLLWMGERPMLANHGVR